MTEADHQSPNRPAVPPATSSVRPAERTRECRSRALGERGVVARDLLIGARRPTILGRLITTWFVLAAAAYPVQRGNNFVDRCVEKRADEADVEAPEVPACRKHFSHRPQS